MSRWWRAYEESVDHPKLLLLSDRAHRAWFNLLCLASTNGGRLPERKVIELKLRLPAGKVDDVFKELMAVELLEDDGNGLVPHNWNVRQYKSDVSTDRVKRFRERERNVSATPPEYRVQITEAESKKEKVSIRSVAVATRPQAHEKFSEFWKAYPKRDGSNPRSPAEKKFTALVKSGEDPARIIAGAKRYAAELRAKGDEHTKFVAQAVTWLNQQRHNDYQPPPARQDIVPPGAPTDAELRAKYAQPIDANGAADHAAELPPAGAGLREGIGRNGVSGDHARQPGMRRLGAVLPDTPRRDAARVQDADERENPGDDGPGAVAGVVRSDVDGLGIPDFLRRDLITPAKPKT